jgi:hypothetical protein
MPFRLLAQPETVIRGFADAGANYRDGQTNFTLGEWDLFITSDISDRVSFLGETVFRYSPNSPTRFDVSVERIIVKYNLKENHNILVGKHHTPVNYWNDAYHHGRVLFPTIFRPAMFDAGVIPLHITGIRLQGQNIGKHRFGYEALIGNGEASTDAIDFNSRKAIMLGVNATPYDRLRFGLTYYRDDIPAGATLHHSSIVGRADVTQSLYSSSVSYFGNKFEVLAESSIAVNENDSTGSPVSSTAYLYAGYKIRNKFVPYFRLDALKFSESEVLFSNHPQYGGLIGLRYEINYLAVAKLEYSYTETRHHGNYLGSAKGLYFQFAVGF